MGVPAPFHSLWTPGVHTDTNAAMPTKDHFQAVAKQIAEYLNSFGLAFKTYTITQLDQMIKATAGEGARVTTESSWDEMEMALLQRGLIVFPTLQNAEDGHVRIYRAGTVVGNLLQAFRYPGQSSDSDLAGLLRTLRARRNNDASGNPAPQDDLANHRFGPCPSPGPPGARGPS